MPLNTPVSTAGGHLYGCDLDCARQSRYRCNGEACIVRKRVGESHCDDHALGTNVAFDHRPDSSANGCPSNVARRDDVVLSCTQTHTDKCATLSATLIFPGIYFLAEHTPVDYVYIYGIYIYIFIYNMAAPYQLVCRKCKRIEVGGQQGLATANGAPAAEWVLVCILGPGRGVEPTYKDISVTVAV